MKQMSKEILDVHKDLKAVKSENAGLKELLLKNQEKAGESRVSR